ncbi:MAG TPA: PilX N-terminal domain-containing pilus assembly protein [Gammaproteobacteria bacterium]|jgi:type IV pilus assembly protein PilX
MNKPTHTVRARQQGVVLVISLLMLLVLTVLGLAATRSTALEERMTANQNDKEVAFESAEAAVRYGEGLLSAASQPNFSANANGAYDMSTMDKTVVYWNNSNIWTGTASEPYGNGVISAGQNLIVAGNGDGSVTSNQPARYYLVFNSSASTTAAGSTLSTDQTFVPKNVYYIYARGFGMTPNTTVTLEVVDEF